MSKTKSKIKDYQDTEKGRVITIVRSFVRSFVRRHRCRHRRLHEVMESCECRWRNKKVMKKRRRSEEWNWQQNDPCRPFQTPLWSVQVKP
ncbi:hypothetical protein [Absidia glauca]|uniref:Uncharacterized protein n=1 Tax=Absidia glauca TaxID=4829 RepID=A0A163JLB0_ABSGL|nr:hypothetical protein [Absidia glauca]